MHSTWLMGGVVLFSLEGFLGYPLSKGSSPPPCQLDGTILFQVQDQWGTPTCLQGEQSILQGLD